MGSHQASLPRTRAYDATSKWMQAKGEGNIIWQFRDGSKHMDFIFSSYLSHVRVAETMQAFFKKKMHSKWRRSGHLSHLGLCDLKHPESKLEAHIKFKTPGVRHSDLKVVVGNQKRGLRARHKMCSTERKGVRSVRNRCQFEQRNLKTLQPQQH